MLIVVFQNPRDVDGAGFLLFARLYVGCFVGVSFFVYAAS